MIRTLLSEPVDEPDDTEDGPVDELVVDSDEDDSEDDEEEEEEEEEEDEEEEEGVALVGVKPSACERGDIIDMPPRPSMVANAAMGVEDVESDDDDDDDDDDDASRGCSICMDGRLNDGVVNGDSP